MSADSFASACKLCADRNEPHDYHADDNWISHACQYPADQQAEILESHRGHRHPWDGRRPEWSGYCVIDTCNCTCHAGDDVEIREFALEES